MNKHTNRIQPRGTRAYIVMASLVCLVLSIESVLAGTRQFLVILANSPKENLTACASSADCPDQGENTNCVGGACLINPEIIRRQYFEDSSFADCWEEISYGDIKINGKATEWLSLPWPISLKNEVGFVDLDGDDIVGPNDFLALLAGWGSAASTQGLSRWTHGWMEAAQSR